MCFMHFLKHKYLKYTMCFSNWLFKVLAYLNYLNWLFKVLAYLNYFKIKNCTIKLNVTRVFYKALNKADW